MLFSQTNILLLHVFSIIFEFQSLIVAANFHNVCSILQLELVIWLVIFHFMLVTFFIIFSYTSCYFVVLRLFTYIHHLRIALLHMFTGTSWRIHCASTGHTGNALHFGVVLLDTGHKDKRAWFRGDAGPGKQQGGVRQGREAGL